MAHAVSAHLRAGQHRHAQQLCGQRCLAAILDDAPRIHTELAATASEIVERLHTAALIYETVADLVKARRVDNAHTLAVAESDVAELDDLYKSATNTSRHANHVGAQGWCDCSIWSNPWDIFAGHVAENDGSRWGHWRAVIRSGGKLWYPSHEQATAASREHEHADMTKPIDPRRVAPAASSQADGGMAHEPRRINQKATRPLLRVTPRSARPQGQWPPITPLPAGMGRPSTPREWPRSNSGYAARFFTGVKKCCHMNPHGVVLGLPAAEVSELLSLGCAGWGFAPR